jgi:hypothetical protein
MRQYLRSIHDSAQGFPIATCLIAPPGPGDCSSPIAISASQPVPLSLRDRFVYQQNEKLAKHDRHHLNSLNCFIHYLPSMSRFFVSLLLVLRERTGHTGQLGYQGGCDIQLQYDILQRAALGWLCLCLRVKTHS